MSIAITKKGPHLIGVSDYKPVSGDSQTIERTSEKIKRNYLSGTASDWLPTIEAALREIGNECRRPNWDGEGAIPITDRTIDLVAKIAATLFGSLPRGTPVPDVIPERDGEICLSWTLDQTRVFSLSVGEHGKINFAGQFGNDGGIHAWQRIDAASRRTLEKSLGDVIGYVSRLYPTTTVECGR